MRITRSTLRRLIAEESARLLREAAFQEEIEGVYGEEPPKDGGGGDGIPKMLHVMYRGFRPVFIVTDVDANPLGEEAEDVTQQIQPAKSNMSTPELAQAIIDFITDESNGIMYVFDEEMNDSETDEKFETEDYVEHLEGLISSDEEEAGSRGGEMHKRAVERGEDEDLFEGDDLDDLDEVEDMTDTAYNDDLQSRHGRFTSPEDVKGTPQHTAKHRAAPAPSTPRDVPNPTSQWDDESWYSGLSWHLRESKKGDSFLDYDPEEIPDMDDQYDPDYWEGLDDETDDDYYGDPDPFGDDEAIEKGYEYVPGVGYKKPGDDSWADIETGDDDVPYGAADVALRQGRGHRTDEGKGHREDKTDPYERGEGTYGKRARREEIGLTRSSMIWDPTGKIGLVKNGAQADDINSAAQDLNDPERTHPLRQTILGKPGFKPVAELSLDLSYGDTAMDTQVQATIETDDGQTFVGVGDDAVDAIRDAEAQWRDMSGGSLDEGFFDMFKKTDPDSDGEDPDDDPLGDSDDAKNARHSDYQHALKMGGGPDEEGFAIDYDTGRPSPFAAKMFGQPAAAADDSEGPEQDDPFADDPTLAAGRDSDYKHAWKLGAKSDAEGFAADYDTGKKKKFPPARGGLSEARWAKLAGLVKG